MAFPEKESPSSSSSSRPNASNTESNSRSVSKKDSDAFYLAKTVLKGTAILQAVRGHFRSLSYCDVVFGKETSIELVNIDGDGITHTISEQPIFGTIKDLAVLPWAERFQDQNPKAIEKDMLLVISDSGKLSFLAFSNEMRRFFPLTHVELSAERGNFRNEVGRMLAVDSTGSFVAVSAYEDQLAIFSLARSQTGVTIDKKILCPPIKDGRLKAESGFTNISGTIWSMCFISEDCYPPNHAQKPVLAVLLNRRGSFYRNELLLLQWNVEEQTIHVVYQYAEAGPLAYHIVEVPHSHGFAFLFRDGDIVLMDFRDVPSHVYRTTVSFSSLEESKSNNAVRIPDIMDEEGMYSFAASALLELRGLNTIEDPMRIDGPVQSDPNYVCSWSWEPGVKTCPRIILSVDSGNVYVIELGFELDAVRVNLSDCIYKGLPSNALVWLENGLLAAIYDMADGVVFGFQGGSLHQKSLIQNIAPILDMCIVDSHDEKDEKIFACSGLASEGSLRAIRSGISVETLLKTGPIYHGVSGTWTAKMKLSDPYHSFVVISFVEQTRVLSVGVSFCDVTEQVGFRSDVCTLACGTVADGVLVQIHQLGVRLCCPIGPESIPVSSSWVPDEMTISLGAVGNGIIVVGTSSLCFLFILGVKSSSLCQHELFQMHCVKLQNELSCISIPHVHLQQNKILMDSAANRCMLDLPCGDIPGILFVIGTHKPSIEVVSFTVDNGIRVLGVGSPLLTNSKGIAVSGCVPQDVRLVVSDIIYVLSGLRNGMVLRFEWPKPDESSHLSAGLHCQQNFASLYSFNLPDTSNSMPQSNEPRKIFNSNKCGTTEVEYPVELRLISLCRIGITPVFLVPLSDSLNADVIALCDRPWLLKTARHSLSYTSICFQPSTYVTPICSAECPMGILFVADNSLHLVEMVPSKRLNVQKFPLGGTPRKVRYHAESKLLLVMRTELNDNSCASDVCCVDPSSGMVISSFKFEPGETGKCMELVKVGNEQVLIVGTSLSAGPAMMPSGEAESTKGRLVVLCLESKQHSSPDFQQNSPTFAFTSEQTPMIDLCMNLDDTDRIKTEETETWNLRLSYSTIWPGMVVALCRYLDRYFLASSGNAFYVCSFPTDNTKRVKRLAVGRTRFTVTTLTAHSNRIAVGDCRDGILFYLYHEDSKKLEEVYCDPYQRLVADCLLIDSDTAFVSDRKGSFVILSSAKHLEDNACPERNLDPKCSYYLGEVSMSMLKGSFSYKLPAGDSLKSCEEANADVDGSYPNSSKNCIVASTLLGSIVFFIEMTREEYEVLKEAEGKVADAWLTAPVLGNTHEELRMSKCSGRCTRMVDGDMVAQLLELTSAQQEAVLNTRPWSSRHDEVIRLLERIHNALV